ncbi:MAG: hypothetical protein MUF47_12610, partial [Porphyrobacter sp.]|nr:hypothetical protein [Porphyrobacter sp.]
AKRQFREAPVSFGNHRRIGIIGTINCAIRSRQSLFRSRDHQGLLRTITGCGDRGVERRECDRCRKNGCGAG